jgi:ParB-like chromosome segregation protein Spo0J
MDIANLKIDLEFSALNPPLSPDKRARLKESIETEGLRDPLMVWEGHDTLVDGHTRLRICQELGLEPKTIERPFEDRDAVEIWILQNQLGRRNLSDAARIDPALKLRTPTHGTGGEAARGVASQAR